MMIKALLCVYALAYALQPAAAQSVGAAFGPAQEGNATIDYHTQSFSTVPVIEFPGGTYKSSNTRNFPASYSMSASLIYLVPGGMREPHWHAPNEWAFVINGTCRATLAEQGSTHPVESWDFQPGDVWYFPSNEGHAVLGLDNGCTYLAVYDNGTFDELYNSRGISNWLSTAPPSIVAQALGTSQNEIEEESPAGINGFMPVGNLAALTAGQSDPPLLAARASPNGKAGMLQSTKQFHRFALSLGDLPEVENTGGYVKAATQDVFPASKAMVGALVYAAPYSLRQMHWHVTADEWEFMLNGTVEVGTFSETGQITTNTLHAGDVGFVPKGNGHWIKNPTSEPGYMILVFNSGEFTNVDLPSWLGNFPAEYTAIALNTSVDFVKSWQYSGGSGLVGGARGNYTQLQFSGRELNSSTSSPSSVSTSG